MYAKCIGYATKADCFCSINVINGRLMESGKVGYHKVVILTVKYDMVITDHLTITLMFMYRLCVTQQIFFKTI